MPLTRSSRVAGAPFLHGFHPSHPQRRRCDHLRNRTIRSGVHLWGLHPGHCQVHRMKEKGVPPPLFSTLYCISPPLVSFSLFSLNSHPIFFGTSSKWTGWGYLAVEGLQGRVHWHQVLIWTVVLLLSTHWCFQQANWTNAMPRLWWIHVEVVGAGGGPSPGFGGGVRTPLIYKLPAADAPSPFRPCPSKFGGGVIFQQPF